MAPQKTQRYTKVSRTGGPLKPGFGLCGVRKALDTALAALREIFDENAYARFLARHSLSSSRESYAAFLRERYPVRPRPRCC